MAGLYTHWISLSFSCIILVVLFLASAVDSNAVGGGIGAADQLPRSLQPAPLLPVGSAGAKLRAMVNEVIKMNQEAVGYPAKESEAKQAGRITEQVQLRREAIDLVRQSTSAIDGVLEALEHSRGSGSGFNANRLSRLPWSSVEAFRMSAWRSMLTTSGQPLMPATVALPRVFVVASETHYVAAHILLNFGEWPFDEAVRHLERAAELDPWSARVAEANVTLRINRGNPSLLPGAEELGIDVNTDAGPISEAQRSLLNVLLQVDRAEGSRHGHGMSGPGAGVGRGPTTSLALTALHWSFGEMPAVVAEPGQDRRLAARFVEKADGVQRAVLADLPAEWDHHGHGGGTPEWFSVYGRVPVGPVAVASYAALRRAAPWLDFVAPHLEALYVDAAGAVPEVGAIGSAAARRQCARARTVDRVVPHNHDLGRAPVDQRWWAGADCRLESQAPRRHRGSGPNGSVLPRAEGLAGFRGNQSAWAESLGIDDDVTSVLRRFIDDGQVRVGVVSAHLPYASHSIHKAFAGLLRKPVEGEARDNLNVTVIAVPTASGGSFNEEVIRKFDSSMSLSGMDLFQAREAISAQAFHVLLYTDIGMVETLSLLAMQRLAPIQTVHWGHSAPTGIDTLDEYIGNDVYNAVTGDLYHTERRLHRVRQHGQTFPYPRQPVGLTRQSFGLPADKTIYVCPQTLVKVSPYMDQLFARILKEDADGVVVLIPTAFMPSLAWQVMARQRRTIPDDSIRARILWLPFQKSNANGSVLFALKDHFSDLLAISDVMLDSLPYGGGVTSIEALHFGLPIVVNPGHVIGSRHTTKYYHTIGVFDLIASDDDDYVATAVALGQNPAARHRLGAKLRRRAGILFEEAESRAEFRQHLLDLGDEAKGMVRRVLGVQ